MADGMDPIEFFDIQGSTDLVTKADIKRDVRSTERSISDRTLTYYMTQGLIPKALRVGSQSGAYPKVVIELVCWIIDARDRGLPIEAIKELLPLWRYLARAQRDGTFNVGEVEYIARQHIERKDANREVPWLIWAMTHRENFCVECCSEVSWTLKNGQVKTLEPTDEFRLSFVLTEFEPEHNRFSVAAWTQLVLPGLGLPDEDDPSTIWLGAPPGVRVCCQPASKEVQQSA